MVGIDRGLPIQFKDTSLDAVKQLVGEERTVFVKGYFPESATQLDPATQYALVHIDCDLYAPMTSALKYFYPRLAPGGYFFIHDYTSLSWQGAERAVDDFFADKAEAGVSLPDGAGTIVVRKARRGGVDSNWLFDKQSRLLSSQWNYAANGGLSPLLTHGWSGPEPWGVWAIGNVSEVTFVRELNWTVPFVIEFDVAMALMNTRGSETIEVAVDGVHRCVWTFTTEANRGTRSVDIFGEPGITLRREMKVRFQIGSVLRPDLVNPEATDIREIGLGLYGVRKIGVKT